MGLTDLFRPRHRHSNAAVRAEAVRQLGPDEAELVASIAREDRDASVRRIAIDKIEEPDVLVDIAQGETDRVLRDRANARAASLWVARATQSDLAEAEEAVAGLARMDDQKAIAEVISRTDLPEVRESALAKLDDPKALAELARNPNTPLSARSIAIERIDDPAVLRSIAVDEKRKDIALAVLDRISDPSDLEVITAKAKNKAARTRARKKLAELSTASTKSVSPEVKRRHAERAQLTRRAEKLAGGNEWIASAAEMDEMERSWDALGTEDLDSEIQVRFERARDRYRKRQKAHAEAAARRKEAKSKAKTEAKTDDTGAGAEKQEGDAAAASPASEGQTGDSQADAATDTDASRDKSGDSSDESDESGDAAEAAADGEPGESEQAAAEAEEKKQREAERKKQQRERQERDLATVRSLADEMEKQLGQTKRRAAEKVLQKADKTIQSLKLPSGDSSEDVARFQELRQKLFIKIQELRKDDDWQRWANVPLQEALIAKAKALLADEDDSKLGERLRKIQAEWKQVGPVPRKKSQELWNEFKSTCDQIYAKVKEVRARMAEEHTANLARKRELCEKVEALAESTDWDQTADEIKALQREWRLIGPVPRKQSDAIWKRFRAACDHFFERRKPHMEGLMAERTKNLEAKTALCEKAEALAVSSDWKETAAALRDLQKEWRDVGLVPRKDANAINKRFRAACDRFFERRQKHRDEEKAARERKIAEVEAEIQSVIAELTGTDRLGPQPEPPKPPEQPAPAGEAAASEKTGEPDAAEAAGNEPATEAAETAEAAEAVSDEPAASDEPLSPAKRALAVRVALRDLELVGGRARAIHTRANELYTAVLTADTDAFQGTELDPRASQQKKSKLLQQAEEIAPPPRESAPEPSAQSPEQLAETLRTALAQNALSSSLAKSTDGQAIADTVAGLRDAWSRVGPVPGDDGQSLEARFEAACKRALQNAGVSERGDNR